MKSKTIALSTLALAAAFVLTPASADAFWGGGEHKQGKEMTQERFDEMKQLFLNNDFTAFVEAMKVKREEHKAERETKREEMKLLKDSITRNIENIDNGVVMTLTSDNAEAVTHLQSKEQKSPQREGVTKTVENLTNGVRVTITSDDPEHVEKIQNRHDKENGEHGFGQGKRSGKRGFGQNRFEQNEDGDEDGDQDLGRRRSQRRGIQSGAMKGGRQMRGGQGYGQNYKQNFRRGYNQTDFDAE